MPPKPSYNRPPPDDVLASLHSRLLTQSSPPTNPTYGVSPIALGIHILGVIGFGVGTIVVATRKGSTASDIWGVAPELITEFVGLTTFLIAYYWSRHRFWRRTAKRLYDEGMIKGVVLVLKPGTGYALHPLAHELKQNDRGDSAIFVAVGSFSKWANIPNSPWRLLRNFVTSGLPSTSLIVHTPPKERKPPAKKPKSDDPEAAAAVVDTPPPDYWEYKQLPFASGSVSLIVGNHAVAWTYFRPAKRRAFTKELVRVLRPGGKMILVGEGDDTAKIIKMFKKELGDKAVHGRWDWKAGLPIHYIEVVKPDEDAGQADSTEPK